MCDWKNHVPHVPTAEELAVASIADAGQLHEVQEFEHHDSEEAFYEMAAKCMGVAG